MSSIPVRPSLRFLLIAAAIAGCGGKTRDDGTIDAAGDTLTGDTPVSDTALESSGEVPVTPVGVRPPPRPSVASSGTTKWFAFDAFKLGLTNVATGASKPDAWKDYGYDLDGRTTTPDFSATSKDSCKRRSGSPTKVLADGNLGRDNNFGQHVMAVMKSLVSDIEDRLNADIRSGKTTLLLRLDNVGADDNGKVPGALYLAATLGSKPTFTTADKWPIDVASIDASKEAKAQFPNGYMAGGVWVSGDFGTTTAPIYVPLAGVPTMLTLESAVISVRVKDGSSGTIAGAQETGAVKTAITPLLRTLGVCPGNATYDQVVETLTQSADLVSGAPSLQDTSKECNTLSVAFGFTMKETTAPDNRTSGPPAPLDPCK